MLSAKIIEAAENVVATIFTVKLEKKMELCDMIKNYIHTANKEERQDNDCCSCAIENARIVAKNAAPAADFFVRSNRITIGDFLPVCLHFHDELFDIN